MKDGADCPSNRKADRKRNELPGTSQNQPHPRKSGCRLRQVITADFDELQKYLETANPNKGFAVFAFSFFLLLRTKLAKTLFVIVDFEKNMI